MCGQRERLPHDRPRIFSGVVAHRDRHGCKLSAGRAVDVHVTLHGDRGTARGRGETIGRRLAVGAALLAVSLDVAGTAQEAALAGEADGGHASDDVGEPADTANAACWS